VIKLFFCCALLSIASLEGSEFSGVVHNSKTGTAIPGAIVTLGSKTTSTDAKGYFNISGEGSAVLARAPGYGRSQAAVDARGAKSIELKLSAVTPRAVYLSYWGVGTASVREPVLQLAGATAINAVVIDVKGDLGKICYRSAVPLAAQIGAIKTVTVPDIGALLKTLHARGIYTIGRIVTFKDNMLGAARPALAVQRNGKPFRDLERLIWCDPFLAEVRKYNVDLAVDAAKAGFDEIQFDYVRFPAEKGVEFSQPSTSESRPKTILAFFKEAREALKPYNVFLAADVFGYICWNEGDTGIGQDITMLAEAVDYLCPMLYPSGFMNGIPGYRNPLANPYQIVRLSLARARERTKIDPLRFRPWLQAFGDYAFDKRQFGRAEIQAQIGGAHTAESDGWMLWNSRNVYSEMAIGQAADKALVTSASYK
jgi:hypothetical protein